MSVIAEAAAAGPLAPRVSRRRWTAALHRPIGVLGAALVLVVLAVAMLGPPLAPHDPFSIDNPALARPSLGHPMGTDPLGRDTFSGVLHGVRTSLVVAGGVTAIAVLLGLAVGMTAGSIGGRVDDALMRSTEFVQVMPRFFLAIIVVALFGPGLDHLIGVLGLTSWPLLARVVRAEVLSLREREFVEAARADGAGRLRIIVRELLPNAAPAALVVAGLLAAQVVLLEASLGFLGLGDPNVVSLGSMASQGQAFLRVAWWLAVFPGAAIVAAVLGLNLLSDAFTDGLGGRR